MVRDYSRCLMPSADDVLAYDTVTVICKPDTPCWQLLADDVLAYDTATVICKPDTPYWQLHADDVLAYDSDCHLQTRHTLVTVAC